jgi:hypothetical protein
MAESSAASLEELREHFEKLAKAMQKLDRRLGTPEGFGILASVTNAFDGLRYLHEIGEGRNEKFVKYPYEQLVGELAEMDRQITSLQTVDRWAEEATALRKLNGEVTRSLQDLKAKAISPLIQFYRKFTSSGSLIPGDILANDVAGLQSAVAGLESGGQSRPHTQVGFDFYGNQQGSTAQLNSILARLTKAESDNAQLSLELQSLRSQPVGPGPIPPPLSSSARDFEHRLAALESAGELDAVTLGTHTFKSIQDCETFLYSHVPHDVLDTYAYDMVSLIHRLGRDGNGAIQREHTAAKAGYKTSGSAGIFSSFQQALPGPLGVSSGTANSSAHPIPACKDHPTWDRQDGSTGLKNEITTGLLTASVAVTAALARDCQAHPLAVAVFESLISTGVLQWHQFAIYISERYMTSMHQIDDTKESWLFTSEIGKAVFTELHKIRSMAADRTSATHGHKDAARSLWVALQTQKLMAEFIRLKFVGHPRLSPYSISHLFRHRVSVKVVETLTTKVNKVDNDLRGVVALQSKMKNKYPV